MRVRTKVVEKDAVKVPMREFADDPMVFDELPAWLSEAVYSGKIRAEFRSEDYYYFVIETLEGRMTATPGDYIIRGIKGELYPCKPDIYAATYEPVEYPSSPQVTPYPGPYMRTGLDEAEHAPIQKAIEAVVKRVEDEQSRCAYPGCGKPRHYVRHKVSLSTTGPASLEMHRFVGSEVKPRTGDKS